MMCDDKRATMRWASQWRAVSCTTSVRDTVLMRHSEWPCAHTARGPEALVQCQHVRPKASGNPHKHTLADTISNTHPHHQPASSTCAAACTHKRKSLRSNDANRHTTCGHPRAAGMSASCGRFPSHRSSFIQADTSSRGDLRGHTWPHASQTRARSSSLQSACARSTQVIGSQAGGVQCTGRVWIDTPHGRCVGRHLVTPVGESLCAQHFKVMIECDASYRCSHPLGSQARCSQLRRIH